MYVADDVRRGDEERNGDKGMRKILFRGRRKDNGERVEGSLMQTNMGLCHIMSHTHIPRIQTVATFAGYECVAVVPETVGQYTDKNDPNGKKIFEGDIVTEGGLVAEVRWDDRHARFYYVTSTASVGLYGFVGQVIGDIHTTPELLKEKPQ